LGSPATVIEAAATVELGRLGLDSGAHLLILRALRQVPEGAAVAVRGTRPDLAVDLAGWCRAKGISLIEQTGASFLVSRGFQRQRWAHAQRCGLSDPRAPGAVSEHASPTWGVAARGALVEASGPEFQFPLSEKSTLWAEDAARLYAQAVASQWDPNAAIDWDQPFDLPGEVEDAVAQLMTYLVENENAALLVPARFLAQMHPHFREVQQMLAVTIADEARHVEVFTRRLGLRGRSPALSTAGGQASLKTLFDAAEFSVASFLLSVLGEGSFVNLLNFLHVHAPDPVTAQICRLAAKDEARHVAFGMSHLQWHLHHDRDLALRLRRAIERRHDELAATDGLNEEVFDALVLIAAGAFTVDAIEQGYRRVRQLEQEMADGRRARLMKLGFSAADASDLAQKHTRNFM